MTVDRLLEVIDMLRPVLERYRGRSIQEMIADMASRLALPLEDADGIGLNGAMETPGEEFDGKHSRAGKGAEKGERARAGAGGERKKRADGKKTGRNGSPSRKKMAMGDLEATLAELEHMDLSRMEEYLEAFFRKDLDKLARRLGIRGFSTWNAGDVKSAIVRHFEEKRLPDEIARRLPADDEAFMEEMRKKYGF